MVTVGEAYRRKIRYIADKLMPVLPASERCLLREKLERMELDGRITEAELSEMMMLLQPQKVSGGDSSDEESDEEKARKKPIAAEEAKQDGTLIMREQLKIQMLSLFEHIRRKHTAHLQQLQKHEMKQRNSKHIGLKI